MEIIAIVIIVSVFTGIISAVIAKDKNRDQAGWFILGFLFNLIGMISIALLPKLEKKLGLNNEKKQITKEEVLETRELKGRIRKKKWIFFLIIMVTLCVLVIMIINMNK